jgi:[ribosomal protein S18]-alanine N-acetyltransferase
MADIVIRPMVEEDIPEIMGIERNSFSSPWSEISFLSEVYKKNAFSNVALFEGNVIGYICVNYLSHESHILNLAVHERFRRRGVATILMNETLKELKKKGCVFMYLEARASNIAAQKFYELFGFTVESVRKKYYTNPDEDALMMVGRV